jgi:hypothetical protein
VLAQVCILFTASLWIPMATHSKGFDVKQGAEAAVHAARCYVRNVGRGEALLKIDFANAFNTINRDEVFNSTADYAPELLPFIDVCYGLPKFLCCGDYVIIS